MLESLPAYIKYILFSVVAILFALFVVLTFKILYKIISYFFKSPAKHSKSGRAKGPYRAPVYHKKSKYKFGFLTYRRIKKRYRLKKHQMRVLADVLKYCNVKTPKVLLINKSISYFYFKEYLLYVKKSAMPAEEKNYNTEKVLNLCPNFEDSGREFNSTKNLTPGIDLVVKNELGGSFDAKIIDVNQKHILISFPQKLEKHYLKLEDMILSFSFSIKDDACYNFSSYITGRQSMGGKSFLTIHHASKIFRDQRREHKRKECDIPVSFYLLSIFNYDGKERIMLHKSSLSSGYIKNISPGGMKILVSRPEGFEKGRLIKLEYKLGSRNEGVVAKIISQKSVNSGIRSLIGIKIIRQNKASQLNAKSFVYNLCTDNKEASGYTYSRSNLGGAALLKNAVGDKY